MTATPTANRPAGDTDQELIERINILAAERIALLRDAADGATAAQRDRLQEIAATLADLWEQRRRVRAGSDDDQTIVVRHAA